MATIQTQSNHRIELTCLGAFKIEELPAQPENTDSSATHIEVNRTWDPEELIGTVEHCLWPHIWNVINVNGVTDEEIETLVNSLIEETSITDFPWIQDTNDTNETNETYAFQVTVTDINSETM
jgi:hypothetical protein